MLMKRIVTATVLLVVLLGVLFGLPRFWPALVALLAGLAAWEWAGLAGFGQVGRVLFGAVILASCGGLLLRGGQLLLEFSSIGVLSLLFWCVVAPCWLKVQWCFRERAWGRWCLLALGAFLIIVSGCALGFLTGAPWLLGVLGVAWVSDISAYFAGRKFGGKKLAPNISPGKTWAGVWGAIAGVTLYTVVFGFYLLSSVPLDLPAIRLTFLSIWVIFVFLAVLGILGDLFESMLKRQAGIKDSSQVLPGHGGVLDRIDSLLAILPGCHGAVAITFALDRFW
ncbi:MAG: phosphatidate cytidylyltransferase [Azoarcus sp.]|jgi:phosphatidate cytidylyltransferase|nr:phosphatidate cytidylyltransferase [Azoarcus sp.]